MRKRPKTRADVDKRLNLHGSTVGTGNQQLLRLHCDPTFIIPIVTDVMPDALSVATSANDAASRVIGVAFRREDHWAPASCRGEISSQTSSHAYGSDKPHPGWPATSQCNQGCCNGARVQWSGNEAFMSATV
jgi:hypothetical protein